MSKQSANCVSELVSSARAALESELDLESVTQDGSLEEAVETDELTETSLFEHASNAREFIRSEDPETVLEAFGLAELPDGSEPSSIPEAIARAPEERLRELTAVTGLARLADRIENQDDDSERQLLKSVSELRERLSLVTDSEPDETTQAQDETAESLLSDGSAEEFRDGLESLRTRLEDVKSETDRESDSVEQNANEETDSDGFLSDESSDQSTVHSTMPSSGRPDMNAVARHSTIPDRER